MFGYCNIAKGVINFRHPPKDREDLHAPGEGKGEGPNSEYFRRPLKCIVPRFYPFLYSYVLGGQKAKRKLIIKSIKSIEIVIYTIYLKKDVTNQLSWSKLEEKARHWVIL